MEDFFFKFDDFKTEINRKIKSRSINIKILFNNFIKRLENNPNIEIQKINHTFDSLIQLPFDKIYKNYLSHPIRVADSFKFIKTTTDEINFGLCHNIIENGFLGNLEETHLNKKQVEKIKILTIDRKKEKEQKYLNEYYDKIENYSEELMIFKSLDKLDNTLLGTIFPFGEHHVHVVKNYVCPRVKKYNSKIGNYLYDLVDYVVANR